MKKNILQLFGVIGVSILALISLPAKAASLSSVEYTHLITDTHKFQIKNTVSLISDETHSSHTMALEPYAVHEFKVTGSPDVTVRSTNGSISVVKGSSNVVRVEVHITRRGLSLLSNDRLGDDFRLVVRQRNNRIFAEVINLKGAAWTSNMPVFDFIIEVPEVSNASLHTNLGNISVKEITGTIDAMTSNGVIHTSDTQGTFKLSTTAGEVIVESHKGEVFTNLLNGDVTYNDVKGESRIKVLSGNVTMTDILGSVLVNNTNGSIHLNALMIDRLVDLQTVVGDIVVNLPKKGSFEFQSEGQLVQINTDDEIVKTPGGQLLSTRINDGHVPIHLRTRVGQIDIKLQ